MKRLSVMDNYCGNIFDNSQIERKPAAGGVLDRKLVHNAHTTYARVFSKPLFLNFLLQDARY